jgi:hypothetical protein
MISRHERCAIEKARDILERGGVRYGANKVILAAGSAPSETTMNVAGLVALLIQNNLMLPPVVTIERAYEASYFVLRQWPAYDGTGRTVRPLGRLFDSGTAPGQTVAQAIAAIDRFLAGDLDDPWKLGALREPSAPVQPSAAASRTGMRKRLRAALAAFRAPYRPRD